MRRPILLAFAALSLLSASGLSADETADTRALVALYGWPQVAELILSRTCAELGLEYTFPKADASEASAFGKVASRDE